MSAKHAARETAGGVNGSLDRELVESALAKRQRGQKPTQEELRALRRVEKAKEEADRWRFYASIPKRHWQEMSGRQQKILNQQAATWGIPLGRREINLAAVAAWIHQFLADNATKLRGAESDDPMMAGSVSPWLEEYRKEQTLLSRLKRREREAQLIPRDEIHDALTRVAGILRGAGAVLQRQFGDDAHTILDEALDDAEREIENMCGPSGPATADGSEPDIRQAGP